MSGPPGGPTLPSRIEAATGRGGTVTFVSDEGAPRVEWARLHDNARAAAAGLQHRGIGPGAHVALFGPTSQALVTALQAVWLAGATAVVLPLPQRLNGVADFVAQTRTRVLDADAALVLVDPALASFAVPEPGDPPAVAFPDVVPAGGTGPLAADAYDPPAVETGDLAVLQFTSGSTTDPRGVMLPHATVLANLDAVAAAARFDADTDVMVSWLPLYHDMGLLGLLSLPMITGADLVLATPQDFMAAPGRWPQWMHDFGGTTTAGPNFSYALAARSLRRIAATLDLSRWRIALNGAEPVDPSTVEAFVAAGAPHGLDPGAVFPAFGMAEVVIGATFPEPGRGLVADAIDRAVLETAGRAEPAPAGEGARRLARLGRPLPGLELRVCDQLSGDAVGERQVGELEIRGTSVMAGYYARPEATTDAFHDGWLRTGDLAYLVDGELVVCGRLKDVIIIGGRNLYPDEVERAVAAVEGVRAGNVVAFGVEVAGREDLIVVAEVRGADLAGLRRAVAQRVRSITGLSAADVVLVAPGSLPKTSSGKLQRSQCRLRYLGEELQPA